MRNADAGGPSNASASVATASTAPTSAASHTKSATPGAQARSNAIAARVQRNRGVTHAGNQSLRTRDGNAGENIPQHVARGDALDLGIGRDDEAM